MSKDSWCSSASLKIPAIAGAIRSAVLFSRSAGRSSWPQALPLFSLEVARWTSTGVICIVSGDGTPVKAGNSITLGSLNCWPKWWVTRSFSSAALQITRPESSWILSLLASFLVISWTARNIFAPSWRRSTSEARWSSLTDALSSTLRRCACRILLRCCLSSCLRAGFWCCLFVFAACAVFLTRLPCPGSGGSYV